MLVEIMIACYILYSSSLDKFYTGMVQDDLMSRIGKHNNGFYGRKFTSLTSDWELYLSAVKIEKHIKRMKSRKYIQNLKTYPEIIEKLKLKYVDLK